MKKNILIVEDEAPIREMLNLALSRSGFSLREAGDVAQADLMIADQIPDLMLLDWMLPDVSGVDFARRLKKDSRTRDLPIIMLTARNQEYDKIRGLEVGADDYVTKPFSPKELVARINAVLRRVSPLAQEDVLSVDGLELDGNSHRVSAHGEALQMGPTEFRMLQFFMMHPERAYSRDELLDRVWGGNVYIDERTVDVHIRRLRKALSEYGFDKFIQTVRGTGYRFSTQE